MKTSTQSGLSGAASRRFMVAALVMAFIVVGGGAGAAFPATEDHATAQRSGVRPGDAPRQSRPRVLPFGPFDPHAVTEAFLAEHEDVALSVRHLAILALEPSDGFAAGDTGSAEGIDEIRYHIKRKTRLSLRVHPFAEDVGRVVLKDRHGRELARHERGAPPTDRSSPARSPCP